MSEIVILYILCRYDATIYKISKIVEELFFAFLKPSLGSLNPAVKKLEKLGCIEIEDKMSQGGMNSKICSITPYGRKYLKSLLLDFDFSNPSNLLNNARIALFCSNVLDEGEKEEFKNNIKNHLILLKAKINQGLNDPYITLDELQKKLCEQKASEIEKILDIL